MDEPRPPEAPMPFLKGKRVTLCPVRMQDAEQYARWLNDRETADLLMYHVPITVEREKSVLEEMSADPGEKQVHLAIWLNAPQRLIGNTSLFQINPRDLHAQTGIFIGDKSCWNKGLGTEAMRLLLEYGFTSRNLRKVMLSCFGHNLRAKAAYEKLGFQEVGRYKEHRFVQGEYVDMILMEVFRERFFA